MEEPRSDRQHRRFARQFEVVFRRHGESMPFKGSATNVSAGGIFLASPNSQPLGTRLEIRFTGEHGFVVEGEVVHSIETGMGVRFLSIKELVAQLVLPEAPTPDVEAPAAAERPREPSERHEIAEELGIYHVRFQDPDELREVYERDLKTGGLFVSTRRPADLGAEVKVEISVAALPAESVRLAGRVVRQAPEGIGLEILNLQTAIPQLQRLQAS